MNDWRDAVGAPSWPPQDGTPHRIRTYAPTELLTIRLRIDGDLRSGTVLAHTDRVAGRAVHLHFTPVLLNGARDYWTWWDPSRMRLHVRVGKSPIETPRTVGDVMEVPTPAPYGPLTGEITYPAGRWPHVQARVGGNWRPGLLLRRFHWGNRQSTAVVWMSLPAPTGWGALARYTRHYVWDPSTIHEREPQP